MEMKENMLDQAYLYKNSHLEKKQLWNVAGSKAVKNWHKLP